MYHNLRTICAVPPHGLNVHQVSHDPMKTLGGVIRKPSPDGQKDIGGYTITPHHYHVAEYKTVLKNMLAPTCLFLSYKDKFVSVTKKMLKV